MVGVEAQPVDGWPVAVGSAVVGSAVAVEEVVVEDGVEGWAVGGHTGWARNTVAKRQPLEEESVNNAIPVAPTAPESSDAGAAHNGVAEERTGAGRTAAAGDSLRGSTGVGTAGRRRTAGSARTVVAAAPGTS